MTSPLDGNGVAAALAIPLVGQFWPGETAMESEDTNWLTYKRERYEQIISAYLAAAAPSQTAVEPVARFNPVLDTEDGGYGFVTMKQSEHGQWVPLSTLTAQAAALVAAEKRADAAEQQRGYWFKAWRVIGSRPMCRDCADEDGTCPNRYDLPCDPSEEVVERSRRLSARAEAAESEVATLKGRIAELEAGLAFYASKANYADVPLQQWFRENEGKDAPTGYRCGNIDISAKPGHAIAPIFADLGDLARRLTHQEKNNGR